MILLSFFIFRYELLRTAEKNSHLLDVIPPPPSGYSASYVKIVAGQAKIYIRPLQQNLSLTTENKDTVSKQFLLIFF